MRVVVSWDEVVGNGKAMLELPELYENIDATPLFCIIDNWCNDIL